MGVLRGLLLVSVIALMAVMPCVLVLVITHAGDAVDAIGRALGRVWSALVVRPVRRLVARRHGTAPAPDVEPDGPPIEQVASDLRRLNRQRGDLAHRSAVWFTAVHRAYDDRLRVACRQLGVEEYLEQLTGVDLDLERVRLEGELQRAGLALRDAGAQQR